MVTVGFSKAQRIILAIGVMLFTSSFTFAFSPYDYSHIAAAVIAVGAGLISAVAVPPKREVERIYLPRPCNLSRRKFEKALKNLDVCSAHILDTLDNKGE